MKLETVRTANGYRMVPVQAAARKVPPAIVSLLKCHGIEVGNKPYTVKQVDRHFKERGTDLESRFACKSALRQIGQLE
jgi:hypothetical protein